jgi:hypothetical protein
MKTHIVSFLSKMKEVKPNAKNNTGATKYLESLEKIEDHLIENATYFGTLYKLINNNVNFKKNEMNTAMQRLMFYDTVKKIWILKMHV